MSDIDKLFKQLKNIYGSAWTANFSMNDEKSYVEIRELWFQALKKFTRQDLVEGLKKCLHSGKSFISLPEFIAMCKKSPQQLMYQFYKALPSPVASSEVARKYLNQLRAKLGRV